ncbi:MAG: hypothetical protein GY719_25880 [bacterium]|nr:hypothetical protein [bacterium]
MADSLTLRITGEDRRGCLDGVTATTFPAGSTYTFSGRLPLDLARAFLRYEWAEAVAPEPEPPEPKQAQAPADKQQPKPQTKTARRRKPPRRKPRVA